MKNKKSTKSPVFIILAYSMIVGCVSRGVPFAERFPEAKASLQMQGYDDINTSRGHSSINRAWGNPSDYPGFRVDTLLSNPGFLVNQETITVEESAKKGVGKYAH
jgi:hypothetical protein